MRWTIKTSLFDPLRIAAVAPPGLPGVIGLTLCPGKKDPGRGWNRDLDIDLDAIREWGAEIVVSLVEPAMRSSCSMCGRCPMPSSAAG